MSHSDFGEHETDPLSEGHPAHSSRKLIVVIGTVALVVAALAAVIVVAVMTSSANMQRGRVVVLMLGDGFGPASVALLRAFLNHTATRQSLFLDSSLVGSVQTASLDSRITDSAGFLCYFVFLFVFTIFVFVSGSNIICVWISNIQPLDCYKERPASMWHNPRRL
jgi:hypothetical protein